MRGINNTHLLKVLALLQDMEEQSGKLINMTTLCKKHNVSASYPTLLRRNGLIAKENGRKPMIWKTIKPNIQMAAKLIEYDRIHQTNLKLARQNKTTIEPIIIERLDEVGFELTVEKTTTKVAKEDIQLHSTKKQSQSIILSKKTSNWFTRIRDWFKKS